MADPNTSDPASPTPAPGADSPPAAPTASASPASPSGGGAPGSESPPVVAPTPTPAPVEDWREARIRRLTAQLHEARQTPPARPDPAAPPPPADGRMSMEDARRYAAQEAVNIAAGIQFNRECESAAAEGRKQFKDFDEKVKELTKVLTPGDQQSAAQYNTLLMAALRTGNAPRVIHQLGSDLSTAQRLMEMDPMSMTAELTRMAMGSGSAPAEVSGAPRPLNIPSGSGGAPLGDIRPDDPATAGRLDSAEWHRRRAEQVSKRGGSGRSASFR